MKITLAQRLDAYERLLRLDKPIGTLLLAWPTLWALWFASGGKPSWVIVWIFMMGTLMMRSAGCAINDYADRRFDGHVERTRGRPLARGEIAPWEALALAAALAMAAGALVLLTLNRLSWWLALAAFAVTVVYPYTKRFFAMPQAVLGVAFSFGIPMAYAAVQDQVPPVAWLMMLATACWIVAYDTLYAMVDRDDDRRLGLKTSALFFGQHDRAAVAALYGIFFATMILIGALERRGATYFFGLTLAASTAAQIWCSTHARDRSACFQAFLTNQWVGAAVFAGVVLDHTKASRWF